MDEVILRAALPEDAPAIGALHVECWRDTYTRLMPDALLSGLSVDARAKMWRNVLVDPQAFGRATVLRALVDDRLVGFASCGAHGDDTLAAAGFDVQIHAIYVQRASQGQGVGRRLMAAIAEALAAQGHRCAFLWVLRENMLARGFYEHLGGTIIGERQEQMEGVTLNEVGYGWHDLAGSIARPVP